MPDPTPERGKAPAPCVTKLVNWIDEQLNGPGHETGHQSWLSDIADTLERQRAEIEALTALVRECERDFTGLALAYRARGHGYRERGERAGEGWMEFAERLAREKAARLRARLAATGESDD